MSNACQAIGLGPTFDRGFCFREATYSHHGIDGVDRWICDEHRIDIDDPDAAPEEKP